jgi:hypothetical protein
VVATLTVIVAAALVVAGLARRSGWHARHRVALATGAMMTYAWAAFSLTALKHHNDPVAFAGNGMLAVAALVLCAVAARRSAAAEASGIPEGLDVR